MRDLLKIKTILIKPDREDRELLKSLSQETGIRNVPDIIRYALKALLISLKK